MPLKAREPCLYCAYGTHVHTIHGTHTRDRLSSWCQVSVDLTNSRRQSHPTPPLPPRPVPRARPPRTTNPPSCCVRYRRIVPIRRCRRSLTLPRSLLARDSHLSRFARAPQQGAVRYRRISRDVHFCSLRLVRQYRYSLYIYTILSRIAHHPTAISLKASTDRQPEATAHPSSSYTYTATRRPYIRPPRRRRPDLGLGHPAWPRAGTASGKVRALASTRHGG